jgi:predicted ribosomally synthesized peptide with SipW-like signal peptide
MKAKTTRRALLMSALSLLLCVSMLIGSTFAWFTDSVTSAGNKIQAGTLDVQLLMKTAADADYVDISNSPDPIFGEGSIAQDNNAETLWEPGKTQVAYLAIKNNGNLALKYMVGLDVENVSNDLYEVMRYTITPDAQYGEVTAWDATNAKAVVVGTQTVTDGYIPMAPGDVHYFALSIHMLEEAGNEYQGGIVNFDLTVLAAQLASEEDSFDNTYDEDATRESNVTVKDVQTLQEALDDARDGDVITVDEDLTITAPLVYSTDAAVTLDLGGKTITGAINPNSRSNNALIQATTGNLTILNGTIKNVQDNVTNTMVSVHLSGDAVAEIKDVAITTSGIGILMTENAKITELDAKIDSFVKSSGGPCFDAISLEGQARIDAITGGTYEAYYTEEFVALKPAGLPVSYVPSFALRLNSADASVGTISGGTFRSTADMGNMGAALYVNNGTIECISGGHFGYKSMNLSGVDNSIYVNLNNGGKINAITGGTFEKGAWGTGFRWDFEGLVNASGCAVVDTGRTAQVQVQWSKKVDTYNLAILEVVSQ